MRTRQPIDILYRPLQSFMEREASGGILLLAATIAALVWANSLHGSYHEFWHMELRAGFEGSTLFPTLHDLINDGLMTIFFFVVGLEIKRELLSGELNSPRKAMLPAAAALGGMIIPALIYIAFNSGLPTSAGWGIPMATDIAFSLGVLVLLGKAVPLGLKVFLTALAIVDDLGAVLVIALFYTSRLSISDLIAGAFVLALMILSNKLGVRRPGFYGVLCCVLWYAFLRSGVHATVAGVLAALTIPTRTLIPGNAFVEGGRSLLDEFEKATREGQGRESEQRQQELVQSLEVACEHVQAPLQRMEHSLHPWVAFAIMPVFALANAGLQLDSGFFTMFLQPEAIGVFFGLLLGKQVGITLFSWIAVRSGLAALPDGVSWRLLYGVSWLAGIGFTMSLFIANLAFTDERHLTAAKGAILVASLLCGATGYFLLKFWSRDARKSPPVIQ